MGVLSRNELSNLAFNKMSISGQEPFFYALIDDRENQSRIARKLRALPGVKRVDLLSSKSITSKASEVIKNVGVGLDSDLLNLDYSGLKIVFVKEVSMRSINLIRDYLNRLVGKKNITMGGVKEPHSNKLKISDVLVFLKSWGSSLTLTILFVMWVTIFFLFENTLAHNSYLIENFQRRKNVSVKMLTAGLVSIVLASLILYYVSFGIPSTFSFFLILGIAGFAVALQVRTFKWYA